MQNQVQSSKVRDDLSLQLLLVFADALRRVAAHDKTHFLAPVLETYENVDTRVGWGGREGIRRHFGDGSGGQGWAMGFLIRRVVTSRPRPLL